MKKANRKNETDFMKQGQLDHGSRPDVRLFRNNVGQAWQGKKLKYQPGAIHRVQRGDLILKEARPVTFGLAVGSADLIGMKRVTITPDMVGQTLAVFTSIETKTLTGRKREEQIDWTNFVRWFGGYSGFARTAQDFSNILDGANDNEQ